MPVMFTFVPSIEVANGCGVGGRDHDNYEEKKVKDIY